MLDKWGDLKWLVVFWVMIFFAAGLKMGYELLLTDQEVGAVEATSGPGYCYYDNGKGQVKIIAADPQAAYELFEGWSEDHLDRYKRIMFAIPVSATTSSFIIAYYPDNDSLATAKMEE